MYGDDDCTTSIQCTRSMDLIKYIGLEGISKAPSLELKSDQFAVYFELSKLNKIPLLFLRATPYNSIVGPMLTDYEQRYENTLSLIAYTAGLLERKKIRYVLFKTLKPFPYTPSDIDVLLFSDEDLLTITRMLKDRGFIPLERNKLGLTIFSRKHRMSVDFTTQIAVSSLIYVNREILFNNLQAVCVKDASVVVPIPAVELLIDAAHSIFKEQTYALSDFYTHVLLKQHWNRASKLAECFYLEQAFDETLKVTNQIILNFSNSEKISTKCASGEPVTSMAIHCQNYELPIKYNLALLIEAMMKKITEDSVTRKSFPFFLSSVSNISFYMRLMNHLNRKTY